LLPLLCPECDFSGVWGNNDGDKIAVQKMAQGKILESPNVETYGEKKDSVGALF